MGDIKVRRPSDVNWPEGSRGGNLPNPKDRQEKRWRE
jgi:hypothetical protein